MLAFVTPRIAVCLLTCDRAAYTARTLASFIRFNDARRFVCLHADDASANGANAALAGAAGFETIYRAPQRRGQMAAFRSLVAAASCRGCELVLYLENDWEWAAAFPWRLLHRPVDCVRLYGAEKQRDGRRPTGRCLMGTERPIAWRRVSGGEQGLAHYAGPPSVARIERLLQLAPLPSFKAMSLATAAQPLLTLRPFENVVWHIGDETTADYVA